MSQQNVETFCQALDAFNRGDRTGWLTLCDPFLENVPPREWPESDSVSGAESVWEFFVAATEPWEGNPLEAGEIIDRGDTVIAEIHGAVRGRASGAGVAWMFWQVVRFRNGRLFHLSWFARRDEAVEAGGLSE